jgi:hypothetical protein
MVQYLLVDFSAAYATLDCLSKDDSLPTLDTEALMSVMFDTFIDEVDGACQIHETLQWIFKYEGFACGEDVSAEKILELWRRLQNTLLGMQAELCHLNPYTEHQASWRYSRRCSGGMALLRRTS